VFRKRLIHLSQDSKLPLTWALVTGRIQRVHGHGAVELEDSGVDPKLTNEREPPSCMCDLPVFTTQVRLPAFLCASGLDGRLQLATPQLQRLVLLREVLIV
jgi:hypothetical protein